MATLLQTKATLEKKINELKKTVFDDPSLSDFDFTHEVPVVPSVNQAIPRKSAWGGTIIVCVIVALIASNALRDDRPGLPIDVSVRQSHIGKGYVLIVTNNSDRELNVELYIQSADRKRDVTHILTLPAKETKEYGWMELGGVAFELGDKIRLRHPSYKTLSKILPPYGG